MTIADLLRDARKAHEDYRRNVPHMRHSVAKGKPEVVSGDKEKSIAAMRDALRLRQEADALDPNHLDLAWKAELAENYRNSSLVEWYTEQLKAIDGA